MTSCHLDYWETFWPLAKASSATAKQSLPGFRVSETLVFDQELKHQLHLSAPHTESVKEKQKTDVNMAKETY